MSLSQSTSDTTSNDFVDDLPERLAMMASAIDAVLVSGKKVNASDALMIEALAVMRTVVTSTPATNNR